VAARQADAHDSHEREPVLAARSASHHHTDGKADMP
jgi:hypothetical protein